MTAPGFISDEDMAKLEGSQPHAQPASAPAPGFISDEDMAKLDGGQPPENPHDLVPFLKNVGSGALHTAVNAVAHPIDTAKNAADFVGSAALGFGKGLVAGPSDLNKVPDKDEQNFSDAMSGVPTFAPITLAHTYLQSRAAGNSAEDALEDARNVAVLLAGTKLAGMGASKAARVAGKGLVKETGVTPEIMARYRANPEAVNAAKPLVDTTKDFLDSVDATRGSLSQQSSAAYQTLQKAGAADPQAIIQPLNAQADRLAQIGAYGPERKAAVGYLQNLASDVKADVEQNGALTLDKGKAVLGVLDSKIQAASAAGADTQVLKSLTDARSTIDGYLKQTVPAYADQMQQLADQTSDYAGLANKFRSDNGAMNTLKRIQTGKDPFAADALKNYDQQFGTTYGEDLQNSAAKQAFEKSTTNGSRKVQVGKGLGGAAGAAVGGFVAGPAGAVVGGHIGAGLGGMVGGLADTYGGQAVKAALDAGIKLERFQGTKYLAPIMAAAQRGPQALAVTHYMLSQQHPDYQKLNQGTDEDQTSPHIPAE